jgi:hypothetical protein
MLLVSCGRPARTDADLAAAIAAAPADGGVVRLGAGTWEIAHPVVIPASRRNLRIVGAGAVLKRVAAVAEVLDIASEGVTLESLTIDGNQAGTTKLVFTARDPMDSLLAAGSSVRIEPGSKRITLRGVEIRRTQGYAVLIDARAADVEDVAIDSCFIRDSVQYTHVGTPAEKADTRETGYGSWGGGIHFQAGASAHVKGLSVVKSRFENIYGHAIWGHSNFVENLSEDVRVTGNTFRDIGLDAVQFGCVRNGLVEDNEMSRIGYIAGVPKYRLANGDSYCGAGIDTAGWTTGCKYRRNTMLNVNGPCIDLDGFSGGEVSNNTCEVSLKGDPLYAKDRVAEFGPKGWNHSWSKGINASNTWSPKGAERVLIVGNTIRNMGVSAIVLNNAREFTVERNTIYHPSSANNVPILLANATMSWGQGVNLGNAITRNRIEYGVPPDGRAHNAAVLEMPSVAGPNWVWNNTVLGANDGEFLVLNPSSKSKPGVPAPAVRVSAAASRSAR